MERTFDGRRELSWLHETGVGRNLRDKRENLLFSAEGLTLRSECLNRCDKGRPAGAEYPENRLEAADLAVGLLIGRQVRETQWK